MKSLITAAAVAVSMMEPAPAADAGTTIARAGARQAHAVPADQFTGEVTVEMLHTPTGAERASAGTVRFRPGARTHWHTHPLGQTLVVTAGIGRLQRWGGPVEVIQVGDAVHIAAGVKHWHGAAPDSAMHHIAITESVDGSAAEWMEPVGDSQYAVAPEAPPAAAAGPAQGQRLFGDIAPAFGRLTDDVLFGDVWARPGLSQRDRSLVTVSALVALNRPEQLRAHLARARDNGMTDAELVEAITHLAFYAGWPSAVTAVGVARDVFAEPTP